jgi:hypothetical protein
MTDLTQWKLIVDRGRQVWQYIPDAKNVQTFIERYLLGLDVVSNRLELSNQTYHLHGIILEINVLSVVAMEFWKTFHQLQYRFVILTDNFKSKDAPALERPKDALGTLRNAIDFYGKLQNHDGHWANDYGGPMFLMPGLIISCYISGVDLSKEHKIEMIRYIFNHQNDDGGWGLYTISFGKAYYSLGILNHLPLCLAQHSITCPHVFLV